jgi:cytochrome c-type biogenesis protein CcmH/NrfG
MRFAVAVLAAITIAAPAFAQEGANTNGPDNTPDQAQRLEEQRQEAAMVAQALRDGDFKTARMHALRLTNQAPTNASTWLMLGQAQRGLQDWKGASRTYATAVRLSPSNAEAHAGLGVALGQTGDPGAAKQLEWFAGQMQSCGGSCGQLGKLKADVEAAIAAAPTKVG